jgi:hypothetical protein
LDKVAQQSLECCPGGVAERIAVKVGFDVGLSEKETSQKKRLRARTPKRYAVESGICWLDLS